MKRVTTYVTSMMLAAVLSISSIVTANAQSTWYPGKGAELGTYFVYTIRDLEYESGRELEVAIWLGSRDSQGNWIADVSINDAGVVSNGKMVLSSINMQPQSAEPSVSKYRAIVQRTLTWLGDFANSGDPKPLAPSAWGRLAITGGVPVGVGAPASLQVTNEQVTAANTTWNTTIVGFRYAKDSKIWVAENFPLPIKAEVYAFRTEEPIPLQYSFELKRFGRSDNPIELTPGVVEIPKPPLEKFGSTGNVYVLLYWGPQTIMPGQDVQIAAQLYDAGKRPLKETERYTIEVFDGDKSILKQELSNNLQPVTVRFESEGVKKVVVSYIVPFRTGEGETKLIDRTEFNIVVVPEFPVAIMAIVASIMAVMIAVTRGRLGSILNRQF
uniref:Uncharacterized protein HGIII-42 n=1 Tax=uncultured Candidatus Nitrosocaldus sp. TaxID=766501 RepID=Q4LEF6_9ARCH|nr:hypothetical protein HGIII-42 [uncultured Candidatus Nitrosocaldus sp.]